MNTAHFCKIIYEIQVEKAIIYGVRGVKHPDDTRAR